MRKLYNIVKVMLIFALLFTQNALQAQKCCVECQTDVKVISDKQVLLEKIDLKAGNLTTNVNTNLYVSYRSGNTQKFWTNLVIATAGVAVSTQLNKANLSEGKSANGVSPVLPLGVSIATLPSIWKNRPKGIPQAGLWIQHRDTRGKLLETWEQPISNEAKNDAELLTVSIDKPLSAGTLEVYLQNGSKNGVYYWGYGTTSKSVKPIFKNPVVSSSMAGCPDGYLPNGQGMCCNPFTGECVNEGGRTPPPPNPTPNPTPPPTGGGGCPDGYLPNGNGMCCNPFTGECVNEGNVPPTTQQIYSGEWRCMAGLVPTDGGNCLNTSNGDIIAPVFVVNPQDPGPFPNEVDCPIGSKVVITKHDDGSSTKSCVGGTAIGEVTVNAPLRPNPIIPITPYPTVTYQPVVIRSGGTGGGTGTGGGGGGNGDGRTDPTEDRNPVKCRECMNNANDAYNSGVKLLKLRVAGAMVGCPTAAVGSFFTAETALSWLNLFPPGAVAAQVISFLAGIGVGGYCVAETIFSLEHNAAELKTALLDATNNCDSKYCK